MPRYLVYVDADSVESISAAFDQLDNGYVDEYITLTENGVPFVFDEMMVSNPNKCNKLAVRCAGIVK